MGKKENPLLTYYNREERFAQLMNGWLFRGKPYLKAEDIGEADRRMEGKSRKSREYRLSLIHISMRRDAVLKAFYYYVKRRDGGRTRKLIAEIRGFQDAEATIRECEMLFDIYILGRSNHIEELLKDLDTLPPQQRAVHELSLIHI